MWAGDPDPESFAWIDASDVEGSVFSWIRRAGDGVMVVVQNLTPVPRPGYRLGLPHGGRWEEVLNSDSEHYGGSNVGNLGGIDAAEPGWHGQPASGTLNLPPLATVVLRPRGDDAAGAVDEPRPAEVKRPDPPPTAAAADVDEAAA
jgi:1,4-alpha-glucan branching enzyme